MVFPAIRNIITSFGILTSW